MSAVSIALLLGLSWAAPVHPQSADDKTKPDNTAVNKRDQNPGEATADQQKMNAADRDNTAKIRRSVMADKSLSTHAHNVKIISQNGTVTHNLVGTAGVKALKRAVPQYFAIY